MAASVANVAHGTLLKIGATTILEVKDITGPSYTREEVEVTHQESPLNSREYIPGLLVPGEVTFEINFLPDDETQQAILQDLNVDKTIQSFSILWASDRGTPVTAVTQAFTGFVTSFEPSAPLDGVLSGSLTIKIATIQTMATT